MWLQCDLNDSCKHWSYMALVWWLRCRCEALPFVPAVVACEEEGDRLGRSLVGLKWSVSHCGFSVMATSRALDLPSESEASLRSFPGSLWFLRVILTLCKMSLMLCSLCRILIRPSFYVQVHQCSLAVYHLGCLIFCSAVLWKAPATAPPWCTYREAFFHLTYTVCHMKQCF